LASFLYAHFLLFTNLSHSSSHQRELGTAFCLTFDLFQRNCGDSSFTKSYFVYIECANFLLYMILSLALHNIFPTKSEVTTQTESFTPPGSPPRHTPSRSPPIRRTKTILLEIQIVP